jgi:hypothetical protein
VRGLTGRRDGGTGRAARRVLVALVLAGAVLGGLASAQPLVWALDSVGMTVADMDRAVDFYSKVLTFEKISDVEIAGRITSISRGSSACGCES